MQKPAFSLWFQTGCGQHSEPPPDGAAHGSPLNKGPLWHAPAGLQKEVSLTGLSHTQHTGQGQHWDHETSAAGGRSCGSRHAGRLQTGTFQVLEAALRRLSETSDGLERKGRKKTCSEDQWVSSTHFTNMVSVRSPLAGCLPLPPASKQNTLPRLN